MKFVLELIFYLKKKLAILARDLAVGELHDRLNAAMIEDNGEEKNEGDEEKDGEDDDCGDEAPVPTASF
ncbi:hypothetical protein L596_021157 [Steinernema carpocapsae]|uniref:Uncharacterized protein n=1 Tax=Steinernema carpocapsae TaxID=34508 RepID=A0A4U5MWL0_STECR|nr:hypothetical protein L596_021157 [Steinernema carpocapsae]